MIVTYNTERSLVILMEAQNVQYCLFFQWQWTVIVHLKLYHPASFTYSIIKDLNVATKVKSSASLVNPKYLSSSALLQSHYNFNLSYAHLLDLAHWQKWEVEVLELAGYCYVAVSGMKVNELAFILLKLGVYSCQYLIKYLDLTTKNQRFFCWW